MTAFTRPGQLRDELVLIAEDLLPARDGAEVVDAVLVRLTSPDFIDELVRVGVVALDQAQRAHSLRDDVYACPDGPEPEARIFAAAMADALGHATTVERTLAPGEAAAVLGRIIYKDMTFSLLRLADGQWGVRVQGQFDDSHRPAHRVAVSARGFGRSSIVDAAFRAVMALEEHEVREHFLVDGKRLLDPHADRPGDPLPSPTPANLINYFDLK